MIRKVGRLVAVGSSTIGVALVAFSHVATADAPDAPFGSGTVSKEATLCHKLMAKEMSVPARDTQEASLRGSSPSAPFDVLVIGGGATGCGVVLDAATCGLRVALVEREEFSSGVRYLEKAIFQLDPKQLSLVFHPLEERAHVLHNAPHLCSALRTMTPCYEYWEIIYYWAGLKLYDLVAGQHLLHLSRFYSAKESKSLFPTLAQNGHGKSLKGTVVYYDGQFNDSRFNVGLACTAALNEALGKCLVRGYLYLEAEVAYCTRNEFCESATDFLACHSRLAFLDTVVTEKALPRVVEIMSMEKGWDRSRKKAELAKAKVFLQPFKSSKNAPFSVAT